MAIAVVMDVPNGTLDQYDTVLERMQFSPGGSGAAGGLFHWVAATDNGIRITDVWQSQQDFETFPRSSVRL